MPRISRFYEMVVEKCSFQFLLYYIKMGLGPGNLKKIKSTSCAEFIDLCLNIFSYFRLKYTSFVLGKPVLSHGTRLTPLLYPLLMRRGPGPPLAVQEGWCRPSPASAAAWDPLAVGESTPTPEADAALSHLCLSEMFFHPVPVCIISFLVTLNHGVDGHLRTATPGGLGLFPLRWWWVSLAW